MSAPESVTGDYFFVRRPIVAIVISIVTVLLGLVAMGRLPIAQYPDIVPPEIQVSATYTGADALTIEQSVATPIEQQVNGVDYMLYLRSVNANDGTMTLRVSFEVETNIDMDNVLVQNRVNQADAEPAQRRPQLRRHRQEVDLEPADPLLGLLSERHLRRPVPRQLRQHQPDRPAEARARRRRRGAVRHQRLRDAHLGEAGRAGTARPHGARPRRRGAEAERREPLRQDRRRARAARPGAHLERARPGPPADRRGVRRRGGPLGPEGRAGAPARRRAHRARRAQLQPARPAERQARRDHRRLPDPGLERARGGGRPQGA